MSHSLLCRSPNPGMLVATTGCLVFIQPVFAQDLARDEARSAAPQLTEIIVTAQKFAEPASKTPVTLSAMNSDQLERLNYTSIEDFRGTVPGLQVNDYVGQPRANIRGIGQNTLSLGFDSQIAFNQDGVFLGQSFGAAQAFLDVERIEVLRGPQGTLYGRNATGGAINMISARPGTEFEGYARLSVGNYDALRTELVVSGPLAGDAVLGRLAVGTDYHEGYSRNLFDGRRYDDSDSRSVRGTLVFNLSPDWTLTVIGDYFHRDDGSRATHLIGTSPGYPTMAGVVLGGSTVPLDANGQAIQRRLLNVNTVPESKQESGGLLAELVGPLTDGIHRLQIAYCVAPGGYELRPGFRFHGDCLYRARAGQGHGSGAG